MNHFFIELLQITFGVRKQLSKNLTKEDWKDVWSIAEQQCVTGIVFSAIENICAETSHFPPHQTPPADLLMKWIGQTERLKSINELVDKRCEDITKEFAADGYKTCILKGQANALYYPTPSLRSPGDIDIWVSPKLSTGLSKDRIEIANYVIKQAIDYERMQFHHIDYHIFDDIEVEVHFCPMILFNQWKNNRLQEKFKNEMEFCFMNWAKGKGFCTLTYIPNVLMQLVHMYRHIFDGGLGLKQIIDFYYLMKEIYSRQGTASYKQIQQDIDDIGLTNFCGGVCYVIDTLILNGTDNSFLIAQPNKKHGELLLGELQKWGKKEKKGSKKTTKFRNFTGSIARNSRLWKYYPSDCIWNVIYRLSQFFWRKIHGWK